MFFYEVIPNGFLLEIVQYYNTYNNTQKLTFWQSHSIWSRHFNKRIGTDFYYILMRLFVLFLNFYIINILVIDLLEHPTNYVFSYYFYRFRHTQIKHHILRKKVSTINSCLCYNCYLANLTLSVYFGRQCFKI